MADAPQSQSQTGRRWYRPTPDRLVLGLLAIEGFLILSDWFGWFTLNRHKGYAALLSMASVGTAGVLVLLWFAASTVFRWRFQFSIRSMLLLAVIVAIPCSWLAEARKQRELVEQIANSGGRVSYDYQLDPSGNEIPGAVPPGPPRLRTPGGR